MSQEHIKLQCATHDDSEMVVDLLKNGNTKVKVYNLINNAPKDIYSRVWLTPDQAKELGEHLLGSELTSLREEMQRLREKVSSVEAFIAEIEQGTPPLSMDLLLSPSPDTLVFNYNKRLFTSRLKTALNALEGR